MIEITEKCPFCTYTIKYTDKYHSDGTFLGRHIAENHLDCWLDEMMKPNNRKHTASVLLGNSCHKHFAMKHIVHKKV